MRLFIGTALLALTGCIVDSEFDEGDAAAMDAQVADAGTGGAGGGTGGAGGVGGGFGGAGGGEVDAGAGGAGGGEVDAGAGGAGGGAGEPGTCEFECVRLGACSVELCEGITEDLEQAFVDGCLETCAGMPALAALASSQDNCEGLVETLRNVSSDYSETCDGAPGPAPEPEPRGDTAPLGPINAFGPSARVTWLDIPEDAQGGLEAGCTVAGARRGSAMSGLLGVLGGAGLPELVSRDANGDIQMVTFVQLEGWRAGLTGNAAGHVRFAWLPSLETPAGFVYQRAAFVDGDPARGPITGLRTSLEGARVTSLVPEPATVTLTMYGGLDLVLPLTKAAAHGDLRVAPGGFNLSNAVLEGYLTRDGLVRMLDVIYDGCEGEEPAEICGQLQGVAPTREDGLALMEGLIGYDVAFDDRGTPQDCEENCEATGVCFQFEATATPVVGVED